MRPSKILTLGGPQRYVDTFAVTPARLVPLVGTLAVSGGALQAATAGDWLLNRVENPELTTDVTSWTLADVTVARVDSTLDPGANSGGADKWALKVTATGANPFAYQSISTVLGATYNGRARGYAPNANVGVNVANFLANNGAVGARVTAEDVWQLNALDSAFLAAATSSYVYCWLYGGAVGDIGYFDALAIYRQNTPALVAGWASPNFVATLDHISPAAGVVPFSKLIRYTDPLNYWEVRVTPNLAGDDLTIWQITAGVGTPRAAADVDWTSNGLDQLRVVTEGSVIGTEYKKSGAGSWTDSANWSSATQGQGAPGIGPMFWGTGTGRLDALEVVAR